MGRRSSYIKKSLFVPRISRLDLGLSPEEIDLLYFSLSSKNKQVLCKVLIGHNNSIPMREIIQKGKKIKSPLSESDLFKIIKETEYIKVLPPKNEKTYLLVDPLRGLLSEYGNIAIRILLNEDPSDYMKQHKGKER